MVNDYRSRSFAYIVPASIVLTKLTLSAISLPFDGVSKIVNALGLSRLLS